MNRHWIDDRDGTEWEVEAVPMMARQQPGKPVAMIGETYFHLWFRSGDQVVFQLVVDPETGSRLDQFTEEELATLRDRARGFTE